MPGFQIHGTGGDRGGGPNSTSEVRRTHRWLFRSSTKLTGEVLLVLKTVSRPKMTFDEPEMHHNQEKVYYAGKHTWDPITLTWYDMENSPDISKSMWDWVQVCLTVPDANVTPPNDYKATETQLEMVDGMGRATETWQIYNGWPRSINWGGLDYTTSELQVVEVEFRFDRAERQ